MVDLLNLDAMLAASLKPAKNDASLNPEEEAKNQVKASCSAEMRNLVLSVESPVRSGASQIGY